MSIWDRLYGETGETWFCFICPSCQRTLIVHAGALMPQTSENTDQKVAVQCPFCESVFGVGLVVERYKGSIPEEMKEVQSSSPQSSIVTHSVSGSGLFNPSHLSQPASNAQRSNAMNPNNSSHRASMNNRSNQMNPNSSAYRSSRSQARGRR